MQLSILFKTIHQVQEASKYRIVFAVEITKPDNVLSLLSAILCVIDFVGTTFGKKNSELSDLDMSSKKRVILVGYNFLVITREQDRLDRCF